MRSLTHITLAASFVVAFSTALAAQDRIPWITDLQVARQMAEQRQQLVLLHFYSDSCAPCQRLERYVFNQPELIRALTTGFIPVKINADRTPQLTEFYKVRSWPTDIVVDPTGKEIFRSVSPQDANRYIAMLDSVKAHHSVGMEPPADAFSQRPTPPQMAAGRGDSRLALDYQPSSNGFQANPQPGYAAPPTASADQAATRPSRQSSFQENPYANPLNQELPQQPSTNIAPRYANPYATESSPPAANQEVSPSPWQPAPQSAVQAGPGSTMGPADVANRSPMTNQPQARADQDFPARGNPAGVPSGIPVWQQQTPPANPSWQQNAAAHAPPASNERLASRSPSQFNAPTGTHPPVALDGYCPVALATKTKWTKGDPRWGAVHRGRTYLFSSPAEQQQFLANPDILSPILSGYDPVRFTQTGQLVEGKRQHGVFYRDRICLFADEAALHQFSKQPDQYVAAALQAMQRAANSGQ
jgi:thioredoxin-related protein/YHS domain-containing protein